MSTVSLLILHTSLAPSQTRLLAELFRLLSSILPKDPQMTQGEISSSKSCSDSQSAHAHCLMPGFTLGL